MVGIGTKLTLEEFLALPDGDVYYEFVDGQAVPKVSPKFFHSTLQFALCRLIRAWCKGKGRVLPEWAILLKRQGKDWAPVPDLTYISYARLPKSWRRNEACPAIPELVIEVISPDQTMEEFEEKAKDYLAAGVTRVRNKFKTYIANSVDSLEEFFFYLVYEVSAVDPKFSFVYLIDELDALAPFPNQIKETRLLFKQLIRRAKDKFGSKIRLLMYLVGTSDNVESFITEDSVMESLLGDSVINLNKGYTNEFELIRKKIDERIEGAYKGYKNFAQAWQEIKDIPLNPANTLRDFCRDYAGSVLEIHQKYFQEAPEQVFEGNSRQLVESQCRQQWGSYLNQKSYTLSAVSTTTVIARHAFDSYVELLHNGNPVARAFGEAKNYELLSSHLETFNQWLEDANFKPDGTPRDISFMIAPSCPPQLDHVVVRRRLALQLQNINRHNAEGSASKMTKSDRSQA